MDKSLRKITTRIWHTALDRFEERMEEQCLRRDAYLNRVLDIELKKLDEEVSMANSPDAEAFVTDRLKQVDRKMISLAIRADLADKLDAICSAKRIVRDAFFNRLFLMLAAPTALIDRLFFSAVADEWKQDLLRQDESAWKEYFLDAFYPLAQEINPFMGIREALDMYATERMSTTDMCLPDGRVVQVHTWLPGQVEAKLSVYTAFLDRIGSKGPELYGFNTYVPDWRIPDHPSELATRVSLEDLI